MWRKKSIVCERANELPSSLLLCDACCSRCVQKRRLTSAGGIQTNRLTPARERLGRLEAANRRLLKGALGVRTQLYCVSPPPPPANSSQAFWPPLARRSNSRHPPLLPPREQARDGQVISDLKWLNRNTSLRKRERENCRTKERLLSARSHTHGFVADSARARPSVRLPVSRTRALRWVRLSARAPPAAQQDRRLNGPCRLPLRRSA